MSKKAVILSLAITICMTLGSRGQTTNLEDGNWTTFNNDNNERVETRMVEHQGKKSVYLKRHEVALPDLDFDKYTNFSLEFEVNAKAMPGVGFRALDLWSYEFVFLRLNNSGKQTAVQYVPVHNGASSWQLYNYPIYEGVAEFDKSDWINIRLEVFNDAMRIFVNDSPKPNLSVRLSRDNPEAKYLFLKTNFDEAYFTNINIKELKRPFEVKTNPRKATFLTNWEISEQFESRLRTQFEVYSIMDEKRNLRSIRADEHGLVNLSKYYDHPRNWALAKTVFFSNREQTKDLLFDYSSMAALVLNGRIIFFGREMDTDNYGLVEDGEQKQILKLKEGENTLAFLIKADDLWQEGMGNPTYLGRTQAMNWGFIARLSDYSGITLRN